MNPTKLRCDIFWGRLERDRRCKFDEEILTVPEEAPESSESTELASVQRRGGLMESSNMNGSQEEGIDEHRNRNSKPQQDPKQSQNR